MNNKLNITIIGYGRFGKLLHKMLQPHGTISVVEKKKIRDKGVRQTGWDDLNTADWIIPAVPISALESVLKKIKPLIKPGALVMDVSSVKVMPCRWMKNVLPRDTQIIGTHPMFGPDSAKYGFKGLNMIFCPVRISQERLKGIIKIFQQKKLNTIITTPIQHDREAAKSLALVHFIGRGLSQVRIKNQTISTLGFERLLSVNETVTNDSWQLFYDMHRYNPYAATVRHNYIEALRRLNGKI